MSFDDSGELKMELKEIQFRLDTSTEWLDIAIDRLYECEQANIAMMAAYSANEEIGDHLHRVFKASMQAIVAGATFFEAVYAASRDHMPRNRLVEIPDPRPQRPRAAYVTEQLKRAFGLKKQGTANLASVLGEVYRFRDEAVHPKAAFGPPAMHQELNLLVERRFATFTFRNAQLLVRSALAYCKILPEVARKQGPTEIQNLAEYLLKAGEPHFNRWEKSYGPLLDVTAA